MHTNPAIKHEIEMNSSENKTHIRYNRLPNERQIKYEDRKYAKLRERLMPLPSIRERWTDQRLKF